MSELDLNLLRTLDALLETQSVTRAATKLGLGQPATSHALARLREAFDDPLFVRSGRGMQPTPRALALREPVRRWLEEGQRLVRDVGQEDPSLTERTFELRLPDLVAPLYPAIARAVHEVTPRARLAFRSRASNDPVDLASGAADLLITPLPPDGPGLVSRRLGRLRFGVVARSAHPGIGRSARLGLRSYLAHGHVVVRTGHGGRSIVQDALARAGHERRISFEVPSFLAALVTVANTDALFTVPVEPARPLFDSLGLVGLRLPVEVAPVLVAAVWHERFHADAVHRLIRGAIVRSLDQFLTR